MYDTVVSSSPPAALRSRWDVFISFRGEDTRTAFTKNLHTLLASYDVRAFMDDTGMSKGDEIGPVLREAIEDSAGSIVIISPRYADSHWCLDELVQICDLRRLILPVFYQVDPSDVKGQKGPFAQDFSQHLEKYGEDKVRKWRAAMKRVGSISGYVYDSREEKQLISRLANRVLTELSKTPVGLATCTVGLDSKVESLVRLLDLKSKQIQVLRLYGIGGVGKTTLATVLYNRIIPHFEKYRCFLHNVKETCKHDEGLISLQNKLLAVLSSNTLPAVNEIGAGIVKIKQAGNDKKLLLVLDDMDEESHLNALAGQRDWFGEGTRIIITTRDRQVLAEHVVGYEVRELNPSDSLHLFCYHAMRKEKPTDEYMSVSEEIVSLTGGLPLALEVLGSHLLYERGLRKWKAALERLRVSQPRNLQDVLRISFDGLDEEQKCVFLDIACLFVKMGMERGKAIDILKGCGFGGETSIDALIAKCLVKINSDSSLWMHDQVRDMGRQIVIDENLTVLGKRSRLWDREKIMRVLRYEKETSSVQGLILDIRKKLVGDRIPRNAPLSPPNDPCPLFTFMIRKWERWFQRGAAAGTSEGSEQSLHTEGLKGMTNLRLLQISHATVEGNFKYVPGNLKWLEWKNCPLKNLPSDYCPAQLAVLDLSESGIERVWAPRSSKVAENLMVLNLHGCHNLVAIPDLSGYAALEKLDLELCHQLTNLHKSLGKVQTLLQLNLARCSNLVALPCDVSGLKSLHDLNLSGCKNLKQLPEGIGSLNSLRELLVDETAITQLPSSIYGLTKLEKLSMNGCQFIKKLPDCLGNLLSLKELSLDGSGLEELPDSVGFLSHLETLSLMWCSFLVAIPKSVGNLKSLIQVFASNTAIKELPDSIGSLSYLQILSVRGCKSLIKLPATLGGLSSVCTLDFDGTPITFLPDQIGELKMVKELDLRVCLGLLSLPKAIGRMLSLTTINLSGANITELPESFEKLENLVLLRLTDCKKLSKLPDLIGNLKSLHQLFMEKTAVTELPESFGNLSSLMELKMGKKPSESPTIQDRNVAFPASFSNLSSLEHLDARAWRISGSIPDDFERLTLLETLDLGYNNFCSLPSSLQGLSLLRTLLLRHCEKLKSLPPLPSSLVKIDASNCYALESIPDISNLKSLESLELANCERVLDVPGIECLETLRWLFMSGCIACSSAVKGRLSKVALRHMRVLSMPGSRIPDWFSNGVVTFTEREHHKIKAVIIAVVVSLDQQIKEEFRVDLTVIPFIDARVLQLDKPVFSTALILEGVPMTDKDQMYLCRYSNSYPLVSLLENGCKIEVTRQPVLEGVHLKKYGIHLVYENDDDYGGDEESLAESQQSVSQTLVNFFNSVDQDINNHVC